MIYLIVAKNWVRHSPETGHESINLVFSFNHNEYIYVKNNIAIPKFCKEEAFLFLPQQLNNACLADYI